MVTTMFETEGELVLVFSVILMFSLLVPQVQHRHFLRPNIAGLDDKRPQKANFWIKN